MNNLMITAWKKIKEEPIWTGFRKLTKKTFQLSENKIIDFEIKNEGRVVSVLALTPDNKVILAKQFRPGPEKILMEIPGGVVDADENPEQSAERELLEETGYKGNLKFVGTNWHCAYSDTLRYNFVATNCQKIQEQKLEDNEFAEIVEMSLDDFKKHLQTGELTNTECGYLGLNYLGML